MAAGSVNLYQKTIMSILSNPQVRKLLGPTVSSDILTSIDQWLGHIRGQFYIPVWDIEAGSVSQGLTVKDRVLSLSADWGVKLMGSVHPYINKPINVRSMMDRVLICNTCDALTGEAFPATLLDSNLNFITTIGEIGTNLALGQYKQADDFFFAPSKSLYFVLSTADKVLQTFSTKGVFSGTVGTGVDDVASLGNICFSTPIAAGMGEAGLYVCNRTGVVSGGVTTSKQGSITLLAPDLSFKDNLVYAGKTSGSGKVFDGEISNPKDMVVLVNPDRLVVLNGNDEIGVFNSQKGYELEKVINIPAEIYSPSLGLSKIAVSGDTVYVTATNTGEVIALSLSTGRFLGKFGVLKNESTIDSDQTLGVFNGLAGICVKGDKLITCETLNNRIQQFGSYVVQNPEFSFSFSPVSIPTNAELHDIVAPIGTDLTVKINVIDKNTSQEFSRDTAVMKKTSYFSVKLYVAPQKFSMKHKELSLYPLYVLCEENNG